MLDIYVKEFISIVDYLQKQDGCLIKGDYLIADKKAVEQLMNRNNFEKAANKLFIWKELRWIETSENKITKRVRNGEELISAICINMSVHKQLKSLKKQGVQK